MEVILVDAGVKKQLVDEFDCTYGTVQGALSGLRKSAKVNMIRYRAVELGGVVKSDAASEGLISNKDSAWKR